MKTDPSIYTFLATDPEAFRVLTGGLTLSGTYGFRSLTDEEIWAMLNIFTPLEETRAYQSIFAKGEAKGLKHLLTRRFGPLPKWAAARIDAASIEQMDAWLDGSFDAQSLEDLLGPPPARRRKPAG
jgi:hypothetical protein